MTACSLRPHARRLRRIVCLLIGVTLLLPYGAIRASATITGHGAFEGTTTLNPYPCNIDCPAVFSGWFAGTVGGVEIGSAAYSAVFPDPSSGTASMLNGNLSSTDILYSDACLPFVPNSPGVTGGAAGSFTVTGGALVDSDNRVVEHGVMFVSTWGWTRAATGLVIVVTQPRIEDSAGTVLASGLVGAGTAAFAPAPATTTCSAPSGVSVTIAGSITEGG